MVGVVEPTHTHIYSTEIVLFIFTCFPNPHPHLSFDPELLDQMGDTPEIERQRAANIARNNAEAARLGLNSTVVQFNLQTTRRQQKPCAKPISRPLKSVRLHSPALTRQKSSQVKSFKESPPKITSNRGKKVTECYRPRVISAAVHMATPSAVDIGATPLLRSALTAANI